MDNEPLQYIKGENNNTLTDLLQNHNSEEEFDNSTLNFDKHSLIVETPTVVLPWGSGNS